MQLLKWLTERGDGAKRPSIVDLELPTDGRPADTSWRAGQPDAAKRMTEAKKAYRAIQAKALEVGNLRGGRCTLEEAAGLLDEERMHAGKGGKEMGLSTWIKRQDQLSRQLKKEAGTGGGRGTEQQGMEAGASAAAAAEPQQPPPAGPEGGGGEGAAE